MSIMMAYSKRMMDIVMFVGQKLSKMFDATLSLNIIHPNIAAT